MNPPIKIQPIAAISLMGSQALLELR
jgi:hypothetical protein